MRLRNRERLNNKLHTVNNDVSPVLSEFQTIPDLCLPSACACVIIPACVRKTTAERSGAGNALRPANKPPQDAGRGDGTGSAGAYITALLEKLVCDMSHTNVCHPPLTQLQLPHSSHVSSWPCLGQGTCGPPLKTLSHYYSTSVSWDTRKFGPLVCKLMCLWTNVQTSAQDLLPVLSESNASPREGYRFTGASLSQRNGGQCCVVGLQVRGEIEKR